MQASELMSNPIAQVCANPLRNRLLFEYQGEPVSPSRLARRLGEPLNLVSYHTSVLARRGCLELVHTERRRGATEHFYRSIVPLGIEDEEWLEIAPALRRSLVLGTLSVVTDESRGAAFEGSFDEARAHMSRTLLDLDDQAVGEMARLLRGVLDDVERIQAESRERAGPDRKPYELVMLHFARSSAPKPPDRIREYRL